MSQVLLKDLKLTTFAPMRLQKKFYGLLAVWMLMAAAVMLVWLLQEKREIARIVLLPVEKDLVAGGWEKLKANIDSIQPAGILLEPDTLGRKPDFGRLTGAVLSARIKTAYPQYYLPITPDSMYQRAFSRSVNKLLAPLNEYQLNELRIHEKKAEGWRIRALLENKTTRDSLLDLMYTNRLELLGTGFEKLPKRYARLLMGSMNTHFLQQPGKTWIVLVDIEKYKPLRKEILHNQRIRLLNANIR